MTATEAQVTDLSRKNDAVRGKAIDVNVPAAGEARTTAAIRLCDRAARHIYSYRTGGREIFSETLKVMQIGVTRSWILKSCAGVTIQTAFS